MLVGQKEEDKGIFNFLRASLNKISGFTLVEIIVTAFILVIIIGALIAVLNIGNFSNSISTAKLELQQDVRRTIDWIVKDLRQTQRTKLTVINEAGSSVLFVDLVNNEIFTDPQFRICQDHDGTNVIWSSNQIGYTFDALNHKVIRTDSAGSQSWAFNNISNLEFRKIGMDMLSITVSGEKTVRGNIKPTYTLQTEVKLRNG